MTNRILAGAGLSLLLLGGVAAGTAHIVPAAAAGARVDPKAEKKAAVTAAKARKLLAKKKWDKAIKLAEAAVALSPEDAGYRHLLGTAYLKGGRFASAAQAFADALTLQPGNGATALNLALAQIANGEWETARQTIDHNEGAIPAADRGLALALAGDPARAVHLLTDATRLPDATAKTRQNLALAMALNGQWQEARALVALDMTPLEADARITQWAAFARPVAASDQVAALLGIVPVSDPGQPVSIALAGAVPVAQKADVDAFMPGPALSAEPAAPVEAAAVSVDVPPPAVAPGAVSGVTFAAPREVVQPLPAQPAGQTPARTIAAAAGAYKTPVAAEAKPARPAAQALAKGSWYVQLGAYENEGVARADWTRATRRYPALATLSPAGMTAKVGRGSVYRLSVGGFARRDAEGLCRGYRATGGVCFVRTGVGEQAAAWHKPARVQVAGR